MKNILLFFGGKSAEHDISIITALQVKANLDKEKYRVYPIYITPQNKWFLAEKQTQPKEFIEFDEKTASRVYLKNGENTLFKQGKLKDKPLCVVFSAIIACHGLNGEDGTLSGQLELCGVPYTASGVASSAICMDKVLMKQIFEVNNFPVTRYVWFNKEDYIAQKAKIIAKIKNELEFPVVVKPANLGSSIGISISHNLNQLSEAIDVAFCYDEKILVEEAVLNTRELACACFKNAGQVVVSSVDEMPTWREFFGFDKKYLQENIKTVKQKPTALDKDLKTQIKNLTKKAYKLLGCYGVVRIDFLLNNDTSELFISEINSIPGSFAHFMFKDLPFSMLLDKLIENSVAREDKKEAFKFSYESPVLLQSFRAKK
jgi:D-alanine-D-alanine ligase